MTEPVTARSRKQEETRRRILHAAAVVFAERGYTGTSMDEVADRADVGKGTIFYNFGAKQTLFEQLVLAVSTAFAARLEAARAGLSGAEALAAAAREMVSSVKEHPSTAQLLEAELFRSARPWSDVQRQAREIILTPMRTMVGELAAARERAGKSTVVPSAEQIDTVAVAILGAVVVSALDRAMYSPERPVEDLVAALLLPLAGVLS